MELTDAVRPQEFNAERLKAPSKDTSGNYMIPTHETQGLNKITLNDWQSHNNHLGNSGATLRNDCISSIQISTQINDSTRLRTQRKQNNVTDCLGQRITHIERATDNLEVANDLLNKEIGALEQVKADTEKMLFDMNKPLQIARKCLETRQCRRQIDAVRDFPEDELLTEVRLIEKICGNLTAKIQECFQQLCSLRHARAKIAEDLEDKSRANSIDTNCKTLTEAGPASYQFQYVNSQSAALGSNPNSWARFSEHNIEIGRKQREFSKNLREQTIMLQNACRCDLKAQNNAVDQALRVRINEMEVAKNELTFNQDETLLEIKHAEREIKKLKQTIQDQCKPTQIAQTQMAKRGLRPNIELCHDHVEEGLKDQIQTLYVDTQALEFELKQINERRTQLRQILARIQDDLSAKSLALKLDKTCQQLRACE